MEDLIIEEEGASSALKITLGDFLVFINWMNQTEKSLDRAEALPTLPDVDSGKVKGWIQLVQRLEERFRRSEEKKLALEANVIAQEAQLGQLLSHLHANIASLYDNLGQSQKAEEVRRRAEALHVGKRQGSCIQDRSPWFLLTALFRCGSKRLWPTNACMGGMVRAVERAVSYALCRRAYPWHGMPFEFHAFPLRHFRIFFLLLHVLAIINLP